MNTCCFRACVQVFGLDTTIDVVKHHGESSARLPSVGGTSAVDPRHITEGFSALLADGLQRPR